MRQTTGRRHGESMRMTQREADKISADLRETLEQRYREQRKHEAEKLKREKQQQARDQRRATVHQIMSDAQQPEDPRGLQVNTAERAFLLRAQSRAVVYRSGWPDFLVELSAEKTIGVEVKLAGDIVRRNQAKMFAALERCGIPVFIWNPARPDVLVPWRKYVVRKKLRLAKTLENQG
jgi:VRR-NUC domain-containing protein